MDDFELKWRKMDQDAQNIKIYLDLELQAPIGLLEECAESLSFASKMLRVYDKNLMTSLKALVRLRKENDLLRAKIREFGGECR